MTPTLKAKIKEVLEDYLVEIQTKKEDDIARFGDFTTWAKNNIQMHNKDVENVKQILSEIDASKSLTRLPISR